MFKTIEHPAACEIRSVIRFLNARNTEAREIHRQIYEVYGPSAMSESIVFLVGKQFRDDDEVRSSVTQWLQSQAASFFEKGIQTLLPRYDKCLNNSGTYVEN